MLLKRTESQTTVRWSINDGPIFKQGLYTMVCMWTEVTFQTNASGLNSPLLQPGSLSPLPWRCGCLQCCYSDVDIVDWKWERLSSSWTPPSAGVLFKSQNISGSKVMKEKWKSGTDLTRYPLSQLFLTLSLSDTPSVKLIVNSSTLGTFSLFFSVWYSVRVFTTTYTTMGI